MSAFDDGNPRVPCCICDACVCDWSCDPQVNPAIIVLPNATNVRWGEIYDGQVTYNVREAYPAERTITQIQTRLRQLGWRPSQRDFLNPQGSTATRAEWTEAEIEGKHAIAWSQQWESNSGDTVSYGLAYWSKTKDAIPDILDVGVSYFTSETVKAIEAEMRRKKD